jgi:hypothetical protein
MPLRNSARTALGILCAAAALSAVAVPAAQAHGAAPAAKGGTSHLELRLFAAAPAGLTHPDDLTRLGNVLYVAYQNNAGPDGTPAGSKSDIVGYDIRTGKALHHWMLPGRVDGIVGDPRHGRLLASVNEDLNSSLYAITPARKSTAVQHYHYSPSPAQTSAAGTNGGTDALTVSANGTVYIAHSNPNVSLPGANNTAATYTVKLSGTTAKLTPLFGVNDVARVINPAKGVPAKAKLGLTDPDSNRWIAGRDGGTLIQDAQADSKLVFVTDLDAKHPVVRQLNLINTRTPSTGAGLPTLDDIERAGGAGVLFVADQGTGTIYRAATEDFRRGTLFGSQPAPAAGEHNDAGLAVIDTRTGGVTHLNTGAALQNPKGLLFVPSERD